MKTMMSGRSLMTLFLVLMLLVGCNTAEKGQETSKPACKEVVDWVDFMIINQITYVRNSDETVVIKPEQVGNKVGEVTYTLSGHACSDHVSQNGDAAFLPIGTEVRELKGYHSQFRVVAGGKIYQVNENPNASTLGDLLDIEGKVQKVSLESGIDGSMIGDFSKDAATEFVSELIPLKYVGFDEVYKKAKHESGVFLRVYLQDGTSFRMVFYPKANAFTDGAFGTEKLKRLIMSQRQQIKAAAGM